MTSGHCQLPRAKASLSGGAHIKVSVRRQIIYFGGADILLGALFAQLGALFYCVQFVTMFVVMVRSTTKKYQEEIIKPYGQRCETSKGREEKRVRRQEIPLNHC